MSVCLGFPEALIVHPPPTFLHLSLTPLLSLPSPHYDVISLHEALLGLSSSLIDSDGDGAPDGADVRPLDPLYAYALNASSLVACTGAVTVKVLIGSGALAIILISSQPAMAACTVSLSSSSPSINVTTYISPMLNTTAAFPPSAITVTVPGYSRQTLLTTGPVAPLLVPIAPIQYSLALGPSVVLATTAMAVDLADAPSALSWQMIGDFNASEISASFSQMNVTFLVDQSSCRQHSISLLVSNSLGLSSTVTFTLILLSGPGAELFPTGNFDVGVSASQIPGWTPYTWAGTFTWQPSTDIFYPGNQSNTSIFVTGIAKGRFGFHTTLSLSGGTYIFSAYLASRAVFASDYGAVADLLVLSDSDPMVLVPVLSAAGDQSWQHASVLFSLAGSSIRTVTFYVRFFGTGIIDAFFPSSIPFTHVAE